MEQESWRKNIFAAIIVTGMIAMALISVGAPGMTILSGALEGAAGCLIAYGASVSENLLGGVTESITEKLRTITGTQERSLERGIDTPQKEVEISKAQSENKGKTFVEKIAESRQHSKNSGHDKG